MIHKHFKTVQVVREQKKVENRYIGYIAYITIKLYIYILYIYLYTLYVQSIQTRECDIVVAIIIVRTCGAQVYIQHSSCSSVIMSYYIGALNAKLSEKPRYIFPIGILYQY